MLTTMEVALMKTNNSSYGTVLVTVYQISELRPILVLEFSACLVGQGTR
jgi:hypothetical protein